MLVINRLGRYRSGCRSALSSVLVGRCLAANWLVAQHVVFAVGFCTRRARHGCATRKASKPETSILSVLGPVLPSLAPVEFQHGTLERKFPLRRVRMGPLVP